MKEADITPLIVSSVPFLGGCLALLMTVGLYLRVRAAPSGEGQQVAIALQISQGATSFLITEYKYLTVFVGAMAIFVAAVLEGASRATAVPEALNEFVPPAGGWQTMICFLVGAILSGGAGWCGMKIATICNVKTMEAAKTGLNHALRVAFAGGAVMGFIVVALGLLGITVLFFIFATTLGLDSGNLGMDANLVTATRFLSGFGFGASSIALFARVAGGIYTKAADVGADLVGKVESDIPEDDPRNPATIADNVGDNVGDVAGMGADLFESFVGSIIATSTLASSHAELALPFWVAGFGILAAVVGFFVVRTKDDASQKQLLHALHGGVYLAAALIIGLSALAVYLLFEGNEVTSYTLAWKHYCCIIIGLASGILIGEATEYFTAYAYAPTKSITEAGSMGGAATVIIQGLGIGMLSTVPPVIVIVIAVIACFTLSGVYGVGIAAVGMLSTLGVTLATDAYGPIADNAGGLAEMCPGIPEEVRERTDKLDALGNTTAATGKGFAIGSAVLTALALLNAFAAAADQGAAAQMARLSTFNTTELVLNLTDPLVLSGVVFGAMLPYLFGALTMLSVRKAAGAIIVEVQRQFRTIDGLLEGRDGVVCDSARCVSLCTQASVLEMLLPGAITIFSPITVGLLVGSKCLGGLLVGAITSGFVLAVMMSNSGGAWDNAKKYIENEGAFGGKKSDTHKACVVGDTVGDPFKDTSGPSLNILIKLMSIFSLTLAPIFRGDWELWIPGIICLAVALLVCGFIYWFVWVRVPKAEAGGEYVEVEKEQAAVKAAV